MILLFSQSEIRDGPGNGVCLFNRQLKQIPDIYCIVLENFEVSKNFWDFKDLQSSSKQIGDYMRWWPISLAEWLTTGLWMLVVDIWWYIHSQLDEFEKKFYLLVIKHGYGN